MTEAIQKNTPSIDLTPTAALLNSGSPKGMYVFFLLSLCKNYFECARDGGENGYSSDSIERATAALIAFCPNRQVRESLWKKYGTERDEGNGFTASVLTVGELISYLSEVLEFEESSTGGFL